MAKANLEVIKGLHQKQRHWVAIVGYSVNAAPTLTQADEGIAIISGLEIGIETAD